MENRHDDVSFELRELGDGELDSVVGGIKELGFLINPVMDELDYQVDQSGIEEVEVPWFSMASPTLRGLAA